MINRTKCGIIHAHHPDCECEWCKRRLDERCGAPAVGTYERYVRVCEECAVQMQLEGFEVTYDDKRRGIAS